jgi:hypothetical protein
MAQGRFCFFESLKSPASAWLHQSSSRQSADDMLPKTAFQTQKGAPSAEGFDLRQDLTFLCGAV